MASLEVGHKGMERSASTSPKGLILEANVTASMMLRHRSVLRQMLIALLPVPTGKRVGMGLRGPTLSPSRVFQPLPFLSSCFLESAVAWVVSVSQGMGDLCPFTLQTALYRTDATR